MTALCLSPGGPGSPHSEGDRLLRWPGRWLNCRLVSSTPGLLNRNQAKWGQCFSSSSLAGCLYTSVSESCSRGKTLQGGLLLDPAVGPCLRPVLVTECQPYRAVDQPQEEGSVPCSEPPLAASDWIRSPDLRISSLQGHLQLLHRELEGACVQPSDLEKGPHANSVTAPRPQASKSWGLSCPSSPASLEQSLEKYRWAHTPSLPPTPTPPYQRHPHHYRVSGRGPTGPRIGGQGLPC